MTMTNQQIFDRVLTHLRAQGKAAAIKVPTDFGTMNYECKYRLDDETTGNTLMCAAGCLIPDDKYNPNMEGKIATADPVRPALAEALGIDGNDRTSAHNPWHLLADLQKAHDTQLAEQSVDAWEYKMEVIAMEFGLTYVHPLVLAPQ